MKRVALLLLALSCDRDEVPPPVSEAVLITPEDVATVERGVLPTGPPLSGRLEPAALARLTAEVGGTLTFLAVDVGDEVRRGQLLARIESPSAAQAVASARAAVATATAQLTVARRDVERARRLFAGGAVSRRDVEAAETTLASQEANLAAAESQLAVALEQEGNAVVLSPLDGVVSERAAAEGDVLTLGAPILTLVDPSSLRLEAGVPADALDVLTVGAPVRFRVHALGNRAFDGAITRISPVVDPATGQILVLVTLPNPERRLPAGLFAEGRLLVDRAQGLVVPAAAIDRRARPGTAAAARGGVPTVDRITNGRVEEVEVQIVAEDPATERVEVIGALAPGDVVLLGAVRETLGPGTLVEIRRVGD